jgi:aldehyde:ferredoxin oxidoreductase
LSKSSLYADAPILHVNLSDKSIRREPLPPELFKHYLGGRGLGVKLLYDNLAPGTDALSPDNLLVFAVGPSTAQLRRAGFAAVVFHGKSDSPVYLWINNDDVEIKDASKIWGKDVYDTTDELLKETDPKAQVACIGPAGEKLGLMAAIMTDKHGL